MESSSTNIEALENTDKCDGVSRKRCSNDNIVVASPKIPSIWKPPEKHTIKGAGRASSSTKEPRPSKCSNCHSTFSSFKTLKRHQKICGGPTANQRRGTKCLVESCNLHFFHKNRMFEHLEECHGYHMEKEYPGPFLNMNDFYVWKEQVEKATFCAFTKQSGEKGKYVYFVCQFDGSGKPHNQSKMNKTNRKNKKGRAKTGFTCLSRICVYREDDGTIQVTFYKSHNHLLSPDNLCYQPMFHRDKQAIEAKIQNGIPSKLIHQELQMEVHEEIRPDIVESTTVERRHTISLQRILSRARRLKAQQEEDSAAMLSLITSLSSESYNPVLIYKPLGAAAVIGDQEINGLSYSEDIFVLGLQTKVQEEMMLMHASKVLCVDVACETNCFKYQLLNFVVCDENDEGFPVAHIITNKLNTDVVSIALKCLVKKCPNIMQCLNIIVTDDDQVLRGALKNVFGEAVLYFTCWRHLKRAWSLKLKTILDSEKAQEVFMCFRTILEERNPTNFNDQCQGFLQNYDDYPEVTNYFLSYLARKEEWAGAYRNIPHGDTQLNTLLEMFHKKLNSGIDPHMKITDFVNFLLSIAMDYAEQRESHLAIKPVCLDNSRPNHTRHEEGLMITDADVEALPKHNSWKVNSQTQRSEPHLVTLVKAACDQPEHCFTSCFEPECFGLCGHIFSCSCSDSVSPCKHMHKVQSLISRGQYRQNTGTSCASELEILSEPNESHLDMLKMKYHQEIREQVRSLEEALRSSDVSLAFLKYTKNYLNTLLELSPAIKDTKIDPSVIEKTALNQKVKEPCMIFLKNQVLCSAVPASDDRIDPVDIDSSK